MINEYLHQLLHVSQSVWYVLKVHEVIFTNKTTVNLAFPELSNHQTKYEQLPLRRQHDLSQPSVQKCD